MSSDKRFSLLRNLLRAVGLSAEAVDDVVDWIGDLLAGEGKDGPGQRSPEFPYYLRDSVLTAAELSFFGVLKQVVADRAVVCTKVNLGDLFVVKADDQSKYRTYTNKIDRKHVDFLLCDAQTMRPLVGIELDDKSHQRADRRARDAFVDQVFAAAKLPLLHVPVKRAYGLDELSTQLAAYLKLPVNSPVIPQPKPVIVAESVAPVCPKCGSEMILRTVKNGANAGNQFWGCSGYPQCRSMLPYSA